MPWCGTFQNPNLRVRPCCAAARSRPRYERAIVSTALRLKWPSVSRTSGQRALAAYLTRPMNKAERPYQLRLPRGARLHKQAPQMGPNRGCVRCNDSLHVATSSPRRRPAVPLASAGVRLYASRSEPVPAIVGAGKWMNSAARRADPAFPRPCSPPIIVTTNAQSIRPEGSRK